ncbi:NYN domain-containing protein [Vannielia litorea]|uniref:NYN domain-containing protein n=1 Tax=Vannielia litorea TaxID=1217970 RepID=UPI001C96966A|nr:NYN domain-containing protein [Vannielia litorea]MBY6049157.1 NYN domain-containing protein [Vannielia litorea]MBY6076571.1 NYN domain-containing protein [Vannielia litorea]
MFHESTPARTALLIDGDNINAKHAEAILAAAPTGQVARVYVDAAHVQNWRHLAAFEIIHSGQHKNASDILLALDALELALTGGYNYFTLVSSDTDFTHLARRLRKYRCTVNGLGNRDSSGRLGQAFDRFAELPCEDAPLASITATSLDEKIRTVIAMGSRKARGILFTSLGAKMLRTHKITLADIPDPTWRTYVTKRPNLYEVDPPSRGAYIRFLKDGFRANSCE